MTIYGQNYSGQDRGDRASYQKYLSGMDSVIVEKIASASAYFQNKKGYTIVDVGMASGTGTYILALLFPDCKVLGVDINPQMVEIAASTYTLPNLKFIVDDGEKLEMLGNENIIGFFNCSSIHHITSYNNYNLQKAYLTIKRQVELLQEGGVIVIRDFQKPTSQHVVIEFPDTEQGILDAGLLERFALTARLLSSEEERGFPLEKVGARRYSLDYADCLEFVRRKDYLDDWDVELNEEYGYYSQLDFEEIFSEMGLRVIVSSPIYNQWIINNRYINKFTLYDESGLILGPPPTNYIIAGEKVVNKGVKLMSARKLPVLENSFINFRSYRNQLTGEIFDVAQRPNSVIDLLPYYTGADRHVRVLARHGYPRPVINQVNPMMLIDGKHYSGYMTEAITAMKTSGNELQQVKETLFSRAGITTDQIMMIGKSLRFYPSPGGIDEVVDACLVEIKADDLSLNGGLSNNFSGFADCGEIRHYDAVQLLKSIQVGAIPDARLEMNLYSLFYNLDIDPGRWLNNQVDHEVINNLQTSSFSSISQPIKSLMYVESDQKAGFLQHNRAKFYEHKREDSEVIFEYIEPRNLSVNTVVTLPVYSYEHRIYVGIESRCLPVPQLHGDGSLLLAAPAFRVPKSVRDFSSLNDFILSRSIGDASVTKYAQLGGKYFPCMGMTPEQVYPYVVTLSHPVDELYWIALDELLSEKENIRDGHLLLSLFRLKHSLVRD